MDTSQNGSQTNLEYQLFVSHQTYIIKTARREFGLSGLPIIYRDAKDYKTFKRK